jgi:hypothetical protein
MKPKANQAYMETCTGINAHPDGDYAGWVCFIKGDLIFWEDWYKKHK